MDKTHIYRIKTEWTGSRGIGTESYRSYSRDHRIICDGKMDLLLSSDPSFRGDPARHNPEELFLSSLSSCHMLWFLHLAAEHGVVVTQYEDLAEGWMIEQSDGAGRFHDVLLNPQVSTKNEVEQNVFRELHAKANAKCFIANSCNFPIRHKATLYVGE